MLLKCYMRVLTLLHNITEACTVVKIVVFRALRIKSQCRKDWIRLFNNIVTLSLT